MMLGLLDCLRPWRIRSLAIGIWALGCLHHWLLSIARHGRCERHLLMRKLRHDILLLLLLLLIVRIIYGLLQQVSHSHVGRQIRRKSIVEAWIGCLQMGRQPPIMQGHIVVLLFVHLLVEHILFGHAKPSTGAALVNLGSSTSRFNSRLQAPIAPSRCSDICAFLVLLVSALGLHDLCRWESSCGRHDTVGDGWMDGWIEWRLDKNNEKENVLNNSVSDCERRPLHVVS